MTNININREDNKVQIKSLQQIKDEGDDNKVILVKLEDNAIVEITTDTDWSSGCETCDFGSSYILDIEILYQDGTVFNKQVDNMYNFICSEAELMDFMLSNLEAFREMTKEKFETFMKEKLAENLETKGW